VKRLAPLALALLLIPAIARAQLQSVGDVQQLQETLDSSILDVYEGTVSAQTGQQLDHAWQAVASDLSSPGARCLVPSNLTSTTPDRMAARIGASRGLLQQIAALEMLENQRAGKVIPTQAWRDLITLPKFANADEGGLLLQQTPDQVRQPGVTQSLAKEDVGWQVTRTRQLFDELQRTIASGEATAPYVTAKLTEIQALANFPAPLLEAAGVKTAPRTPPPPPSPPGATASRPPCPISSPLPTSPASSACSPASST
jgi:hypothetical protein